MWFLSGEGHSFYRLEGRLKLTDMALDVEIAVRVQTTRASRYGVTVLTAHPADFFREPEVSLLLPDPSSDSGVSLRSHLAPGQARQVHLCEYEPEGDGKHVTLRFGSSRTPVHVEIGPLDCVLKLTGRNFDASEFTGRLVFSWNENGDEPFFVAAFGGFREL